MRREPEAGGDLLLILVQPLRGDEQLHAVATAVGHGERSLQPEKGLVLHAQVIGALDHHRPVDGLVASHDALVAHDVAVGVDGRVRTVDRTLRVDQWRQQLVLDDDGGKRTAAGVGMIGGDSSHRLTHVPHDIRGEHGLIAADEAVGGLAGHVGGRDDGLDPGYPPGTRHVDAGDARSGCGERRVAPHKKPSAVRSLENAKVPCTFATPSGRATLSPRRPPTSRRVAESVMAPPARGERLQPAAPRR